MKAFIALLLVSCASTFTTTASAQVGSHRVKLQLKTDEAEAVLAILSQYSSGKTIAESDWQRLFETEPYIRLKQREASMKRDFSDDDFKKFVLSEDLAKRAAQLRQTLDAWKKADLAGAAHRVLPSGDHSR